MEDTIQNLDHLDYKMPFDSLYDNFEQHLTIEGNNKIFFSGKFGVGKTTFLKDFFKHKKSEYDVYHLYPVNYQINTEGDIVELLKYDILVEFLIRYPDGFGTNLPRGIKDRLSTFFNFVTGTYTVNDALQKTVEYVTADTPLHKLGRPLSDLLKLDKAFQEFKKEYEKGERGKVDDFMKSIEVNETDFISSLLHKKIKEKRDGKKSVLILDDLDRIDPAHIFRILNVFSSFNELENENRNKFGFDKIILVGHKKNIEYIFHHLYGKGTDFTGYINKFFSRDFYTFSTDEIIGTEIKKIITIFGEQKGGLIAGFRPGYFVYDILFHFLSEATRAEKDGYTLRQILKLVKFVDSDRKYFKYPPSSTLKRRQEQVWSSFEFAFNVCDFLFEDRKNFIKFCKASRSEGGESNTRDNFYEYYAQALLYKVKNVGFDEKLFADNDVPSIEWNDYSLTLKGNDMIIVDKGSRSSGMRELFYDLLIEVLSK